MGLHNKLQSQHDNCYYQHIVVLFYPNQPTIELTWHTSKNDYDGVRLLLNQSRVCSRIIAISRVLMINVRAHPLN